MRKFLVVLASIVTTVSLLLAIFIFALSFFLKGGFTFQFANQVNQQTVTEYLEKTDSLDSFYQAAEEEGISREKMDDILNQPEVKDYVGGVLQEVINGNLEEDGMLDEEKISELTKEFYDKALEKEDLVLSPGAKERLENFTTSYIVDEVEPNLTEAQTENKVISTITPFLQQILQPNTRSVLIAISIIGMIVIFVLTIKERRFFHYYSSIALFLMVFFLGCSVLSHIASTFLKGQGTISIGQILVPLYQTGYLITVVLFITFILFFLLNYFIERHQDLKERVPF